MRFFRYTVVWSFTLFLLAVGPTVFAQTAAAAGVPMDVSATADEWGNSFLWALGSSWLMRWWREHPKLSGFTEQTGLRIQRFIGSGIAFANGLGITFVFDKQAGTLLIGGLFMTAVMHGLRQFLFQEFVYHAAIKRSPTA